MNAPIFIIGNPRSGTTLLRLMLNAHPQIVIPPEGGFAQWLHQFFQDWDGAAASSPEQRKAFLDALFETRKFETWELDKESLDLAIQNKLPSNYTALVSLVYQQYAEEIKPTFHRWGDKNNYYINHIPLIRTLFPQAKFIYIVRDGRDVACSYIELSKREISSKYKPVLPVSIEAIAKEWAQNNQAALSQFQIMPAEQWHRVRYEDLVRDTAAELKGICDFLGETYAPEMELYFQNQQGKEPKEFLSWKEKTKMKPQTSQIGRYKREWEADQIQVFNQIAGSLLTSFEYDL